MSVQAADDSAAAGPSALAGRRVLVVEDEFIVALDLEQVLHDLGCVVLGPLATMADALALLQAERPDLALLDIGLRDGLVTPLARHLAELGVPFALMTGYSLGRLPEPALQAAPCLSKPYQLNELVAMLLHLVQMIEG